MTIERVTAQAVTLFFIVVEEVELPAETTIMAVAAGAVLAALVCTT